MPTNAINILQNTEIKNGAVFTSADYVPSADNHLIDQKALNLALNAGKAQYTIFDAVYDNAGVAAGVASASLSIGQYVFAIETVGTFTANVLYKCLTAGVIGVATFATVAPQEGFIIWFDQDFVNPNDANVVFKTSALYAYDADTGVWIAVPNHNTSIGVQTTKEAVVTFADSTVAIATDIPANSRIDFVDIIIAQSFDGTSAVLTVGDSGDNSKIVANAMWGSNPITSFSQGSVVPFLPLDSVTFTNVVLANKTTVNAYFAVTGASQGSAIVRIGYTQL